MGVCRDYMYQKTAFKTNFSVYSDDIHMAAEGSFFMPLFPHPPPLVRKLVVSKGNMLEGWGQFLWKAYSQSFPDLTKFLLPTYSQAVQLTGKK